MGRKNQPILSVRLKPSNPAGVRAKKYFFDLSFLIDDEKAGAQMDVQEQAPFQIPAKKPSKAPKKQLKITSLFK